MHAPDFARAMPFLDKAYEVYKQTYCFNGGGGSYIVNPQKRVIRPINDNDRSPNRSLVLDKLMKKSEGVPSFSDKCFLQNLLII